MSAEPTPGPVPPSPEVVAAEQKGALDAQLRQHIQGLFVQYANLPGHESAESALRDFEKNFDQVLDHVHKMFEKSKKGRE